MEVDKWRYTTCRNLKPGDLWSFVFLNTIFLCVNKVNHFEDDDGRISWRCYSSSCMALRTIMIHNKSKLMTFR